MKYTPITACSLLSDNPLKIVVSVVFISGVFKVKMLYLPNHVKNRFKNNDKIILFIMSRYSTDYSIYRHNHVL